VHGEPEGTGRGNSDEGAYLYPADARELSEGTGVDGGRIGRTDGNAVLNDAIQGAQEKSPATGETEPTSVFSGLSGQTKPSRLTGEEFFSEAWKTAQPANRTETRSRPREKKQVEADRRQRSLFPSEDEQRERISENEGQAAEKPDNPPNETFSAEKYREKSLEILQGKYSSYREYRTNGEDSRLIGIAVARKHDGSALVLNPIGGEITDFTAGDAANRDDFNLIMDAIEDERLKDGIVMARDRLAEGTAQASGQNAAPGTTSVSETESAEKSPEYSAGQTVYLEENRPPYRIVKIGQRMELQEALPGDLPPSADYIDREDFERLYRDNPRNFTGRAETPANPEARPQSGEVRERIRDFTAAADAGQIQTRQPQTEKPYQIGDEVYLDDGANYRIERIEPDAVTLRALGLDGRFVIAFRDMYIEDFERQLRGNVLIRKY
jgi:hypothetical protein